MKKRLEIIKTAMHIEAEGEKFYKEAANKTKDPTGKAFFEVLAQDEREHKRVFGEIYVSLNEEKKWTPLKAPLTKRDIKSSPIFDKKEAGGIKADLEDIRAIEIGIEKEKKSLDFYKNALEHFSEKDAKELLLRLIEIEEGHLRLLKGELDAVQGSGYWFDFPEFTMESP